MYWLIENGRVVPYSCFGSLRATIAHKTIFCIFGLAE